MSEKLRLNREQLYKALGDDPDAVRVFEKLFAGYNDILGGYIVEQGSNSNGHYIRFSSGVQVCWVSGDGNGNNTYPKAFSASPVVIPVAFRLLSTAPRVLQVETNSATAFNLEVYNPTSGTSAAGEDWYAIAIGPWS